MYTKGDFHLHTKASDGKLSSKELINLAKKEHVDIIAVTDHDTIGGINEAIKEGESAGIKVIPGIELSTLHKGKSIHILGYFEDITKIDNNFKAYLDEMNEQRLNRGKKIVEKLSEVFDIKLDYDLILEKAHGIVARPHIAKAIVEAGYNYTFDYIFNNLIGEGCPAYVPNVKLTSKEGIDLLHSVNALTILAHPVLIKDIDLEELISLPFDGIEAIYSLNSEEDTKKFMEYAEKYNKIISAGSDFHGIDKNDKKHASTVGEVYLDKEGIEIFLDKLNNM
ncbi:PHP domain-containing protein [Clostridium sp. DJ247]|uniref:PHP domain-containing protein n=1 Tax=Clostridium sp. DJ247 TaxID=2726188 RepID=UPI001629725D|nr:PHP domain-containing protein [Clostridium sp. DJ247]MBC2582553.1 PHP domain-containing protein [Clostridium sp. DJ247]